MWGYIFCVVFWTGFLPKLDEEPTHRSVLEVLV